MTILFAMALYAFSMSITPGPTNFILLSTGANHGFLKAVPFATGASIGFTVLNILVGMGLGKIISEDSLFLALISYLGAAFIVYMGYKIATSSPEVKLSEQKGGAPGFVMGVLTSLVNPKSWIAILAGVSAFGIAGKYQEVLVYATIYIIVGYLSILVWAFAGSKVAFYLGCARNMRYFNLTMGGGLIIIALYLVTI